MVGFKHMAIVYMASGIGGNMFSSCLSNNLSVGASTADFGILTGLLAMVFVNWDSFSASQTLIQMRCMIIVCVVFMLVMNFVMNSQSNSVSANCK